MDKSLPFPFYPKLIKRRTLLNELHDSSEQFVWVSGPPGSGKTALISSYISELGKGCLWIQIERSMNDPSVFFDAFNRKLAMLSVEENKSLIFSPEYFAGLEIFSRRFFTALIKLLPSDAILVMDDFHELQNSDVLQRIAKSVYSLFINSNLRIIFISRRKPSPIFARLVVNQQMLSVDWHQLKLSDEEIREICLAQNISKESEIQRYIEKSGGWIAGITFLQRLILDKSDENIILDDTNSQILFDYFNEEVLSTQSIQDTKLIVQAACFPKWSFLMLAKLCGKQSEYVSKVILPLIENNYFIYSISKESNVYLFHPLFRDYLIRRQRLIFNEQELKQIYSKSAQILREDMHEYYAIEVLLASGNWQEASELILSVSEEILSRAQHSQLLGWVRSLPDIVVEGNARLMSVYGRSELVFDPSSARKTFVRVYQLYAKENLVEEQLLAWAYIVETHTLLMDEFASLKMWLDEVLPILRDYPVSENLHAESRICTALLSSYVFSYGDVINDTNLVARCEELVFELDFDSGVNLAWILIWHYLVTGKIRYAVRLSDAISLLDENLARSSTARVMWHIMRSCVHYNLGEYTISLRHIQHAEKTCIDSGALYSLKFIYTQFAFVYILSGDLDRALGYIQRMEPDPGVTQCIDICQYHELLGYRYLCLKDIDHALDCFLLAFKFASKAAMPIGIGTIAYFLCVATLIKGDKLLFQRYLEHLLKVTSSISGSYGLVMVNFVFAYQSFQINELEACEEYTEKFLSAMHEGGMFDFVGRVTWLVIPIYNFALVKNIHPDFVKKLITKQDIKPELQNVSGRFWPWKVKIHFFGQVRIFVDESELEIKKRENNRPILLLKYLVVNKKPASYSELIEAMWPGLDGQKGENNLKTTVARLRKLLGKDAITQKSKRLVINSDVCWVDVFYIEAAYKSLSFGQKVISYDQLVLDTIGVYSGKFNVGYKDPHWVELAGIKIDQRFADFLYKIVTSENIDHEITEKVCWQLIEINPDDTRFFVTLLNSLHSQRKIYKYRSVLNQCRQSIEGWSFLSEQLLSNPDVDN